MLKKIVFIFAFCNIAAWAQDASLGLTQRQNMEPWTYKQGTRPKVGDLGFFLSFSTMDAENLAATSPVSFLNFRYYYKNDVVIRLGLSLYKEKSVNRGEDEVTGGTISGISSAVNKESDRRYYIKPGVEKHFAATNMIDVYVAADVLLGVRRITSDYRTEAAGSEIGSIRSRRSFDYGLGTYIGFQAFVADLPLAIGGEVGFQGVGSLWQRTKVEDYTGTRSTEYYLPVDKDLNVLPGATTRFESLVGRRFDLNSNVRITVCYFFSRK